MRDAVAAVRAARAQVSSHDGAHARAPVPAHHEPRVTLERMLRTQTALTLHLVTHILQIN